MDPDGRWTSKRAVPLAAAGQNRWPPAGNYMAATGQDLMAADTRIAHPCIRCHRLSIMSARDSHSDEPRPRPFQDLVAYAQLPGGEGPNPPVDRVVVRVAMYPLCAGCATAPTRWRQNLHSCSLNPL